MSVVASILSEQVAITLTGTGVSVSFPFSKSVSSTYTEYVIERYTVPKESQQIVSLGNITTAKVLCVKSDIPVSVAVDGNVQAVTDFFMINTSCTSILLINNDVNNAAIVDTLVIGV
jgi:hypothetical protein